MSRKSLWPRQLHADGRYYVRAYRAGDADRVVLRADMAEQFSRQDRKVPFGPKWTVFDFLGRVIAIGGLEPSGASASFGWFLTGDLSPRAWCAVIKASREGIAWAKAHAIRRIYALTPGDRPEAAAMLARLGFKLTGQESGDAVMTLTLEKI